MDRAIGNLRKELRTLGIADNTLVWYTSDNGATRPGSTGGLRGKKADLWEGGLRVPAIVEWPARIRSPRATDLPACSVDIVPTVMELLGLSTQYMLPLDGTSLVPLFDGKMEKRDKPLGFWVYPIRGQPVRSHDLLATLLADQEAGKTPAAAPPRAAPPEVAPANPPGHAAWLDGNWKLHRIPAASGRFRYELYDLAADPKETTDLAAKHAERVAAMTRQLADWQGEVLSSLAGSDYTTPF
jgi:arylsulfatase A-like enzyme